MKIVFLDTELLGPEVDHSVFENLGDVTYFEHTTPEEVEKRIRDAEIIVTNKVLLSEKVLDKARNLQLVALTCTGTDGVDLEYCKNNNIAVSNVAGYSTASVVEQTFALLFGLMRNLEWNDRFVKNGEYSKGHMITTFDKLYPELSGKTWGIIGLGSIGKNVAKVAEAFGCNIIYYSSSGKNLSAPYPCKNLEELCQESDIISIHTPLNDRTKNLINRENLKLMKPSSYLLNLGRGGIINEEALAEALNNNLIAGAGLDVFTQEPIQKNNPLLSLENPEKLLASPHIAWASIEARQRLAQEVVENIKAYIQNEKRNRVV